MHGSGPNTPGGGDRAARATEGCRCLLAGSGTPEPRDAGEMLILDRFRKVQQENLQGWEQAGVGNVLAGRCTIDRQVHSQGLAEVGNGLAERYKIGRQSRGQKFKPGSVQEAEVNRVAGIIQKSSQEGQGFRIKVQSNSNQGYRN